MSIGYIELAVAALGELAKEVTFVGGATLGFWIDPRFGIEARATKDADLVVEVSTKSAYDRFSSRLRDRAMYEDESSEVIGRWRIASSDVIVDVLPSDGSFFGYDCHWLSRAGEMAVKCDLPGGGSVRVIPPPLLIATKIEAFQGRGGGDYLASKDFEDIAKLISARDSFVDELLLSPRDLRSFVAKWLAVRVDDPYFLAGIEGALAIPESFRFVEEHVRPKLVKLAELEV